MTSLTRWEPVMDVLTLRRAMEQLFDSAFVSDLARSSNSLPLDVVESEQGYLVQVVVPGIHPHDLDITVNDQTLTIKGEWKAAESPTSPTFHLRERITGRFERSIQFPLPLNVDGVQAKYEYGILTLSLPKTKAVKRRRISVQSQGRRVESTGPTPSRNWLQRLTSWWRRPHARLTHKAA